MKVLIVDDSEPMRRMIKTYLADLVGETFECGDGSEALTAYREHQPDFVLMDLKMTKMDGLDATRQIMQCFPKAGGEAGAKSAQVTFCAKPLQIAFSSAELELA